MNSYYYLLDFSIKTVSKASVYILFLSLCFTGMAQNYANISRPNTGTMEVQTNISSEAKEVDGSPFINEEWVPGVIYLTSGKQMEIDFLNFNAHAGILTYLKNNVAYNTAKDLDIEKFKIGNETFIPYFDGYSKTFYQLLSEGDKLKLLKKHNCSFVKGQASTGYVSGTNDKYIIKTEYYGQLANNEPFKFKNKEKNIIAFMNDKKAEMEEFIAENNLNVKDEAALTMIFSHYNRISAQ